MASGAIAPSMPRDDVSDGALVEAHLTGDDQAFDVLFRRHHDRLVRFCWKQTHDHELAEDLAQEAMIRCLEKAELFDTSQPLWPWLQTVARNIVIDHHRRTKHDPHLDPDLGDDRDGATATTIRLARIEERSELGQVLARLPKRQRIALGLHHGRDWTTADVADYLDIKTNACKQLLYRARNNARKYYEQVVDSTESALSIVFAHPVLLVLRERFQRSRSRIEALAADVAGMTIALDAIAERAVAVLAIVATIAFGGMDTSFATKPATSAATPGVQEHHELPISQLASSTSNEERLAPRSPAQPARESMESRAAHLSTGTEASVPGMASMSGSVQHERSDDRATVRREVTVDLGPYAPVSETIITVPCDGSSTVYQTTCDIFETADGLGPGDEADASVPSSSR